MVTVLDKSTVQTLNSFKNKTWEMGLLVLMLLFVFICKDSKLIIYKLFLPGIAKN